MPETTTGVLGSGMVRRSVLGDGVDERLKQSQHVAGGTCDEAASEEDDPQQQEGREAGEGFPAGPEAKGHEAVGDAASVERGHRGEVEDGERHVELEKAWHVVLAQD